MARGPKDLGHHAVISVCGNDLCAALEHLALKRRESHSAANRRRRARCTICLGPYRHEVGERRSVRAICRSAFARFALPGRHGGTVYAHPSERASCELRGEAYPLTYTLAGAPVRARYCARCAAIDPGERERLSEQLPRCRECGALVGPAWGSVIALD